MTAWNATAGAELSPTASWSRRVRRVGGLIQLAFASFWLVRGSLTIGGGVGLGMACASGAGAVAAAFYGVRVTAGVGARPHGPAASRIERAITAASIIQLVASFAVPVLVVAAGHSAWVLPSIAITIGPLLLWLDHRVDVPPVSAGRLGIDRRAVAARRGPVGHRTHRDHRPRRRPPAAGHRHRRFPRPRRPPTSPPATITTSSLIRGV
jgi:hypothetical protein